MAHRDHRTVTPRYPLEPWQVRETELDPLLQQDNESVFALGNGYLGMRASPEEGFDAPRGRSVPGTYLNGFHERARIVYPEDAYGYAHWRQTMLNLPEARRLDLWIDDEPFSPYRGELEAYERVLDLRAGTVVRRMRWKSPAGARVELTFTNVVSLPHRHRAALRLDVTPLDRPVTLGVRSMLDGRVQNQVEAGDPRVGTALAGQVLQAIEHGHEGARLWLRQRARNSGMELACAVDHQWSVAGPSLESEAEPLHGHVRASWELAAGQTLRLDKPIVYLDARDQPADELVEAAHGELDRALEQGVDGLLEAQRAYLDDVWAHGDVRIEGDDGVQQSVRFSLFHLLQGAGRDGRTNVASKGLTGEGYEGHTFWDTEIYVLPVFLHTRPDAARALLAYRVGLLDAARQRARDLHHRGALYPWRTIAGPEASAFFPAGTAQYHINAAIAYAFEQYLEATDDHAFFWAGGAAAVLETARFWRSLGAFGRDGRFHLHTVTGPDEYTALIDDNHYTNLMAQGHLRFAVRLSERLRREDPERWDTLAGELGFDDEELAELARAADAMHLPVDPELGVHPQDASFLGKPEWPFGDVPAHRYPLLLNYHPLEIYRHQVLKQADVVLAAYLRPEASDRAQKRRDLAYYEPRTTHDSSLSPCAHAIVAARLGLHEMALDHFRRTVRMDLDDLNGNVKDGVHVAAMGGSWLAIVCGFAGFESKPAAEGAAAPRASFHPRLPERWRRLAFRMVWRGRTLEVDADPEQTRYRLLEGEALELLHRGEPVRLEPGEVVARPSRPRLRAVIFDLDGVLTDSAEYHYQAWKALADELGIAFDREANEALRGIDRMGSLERILCRGEGRWSEQEKARLAARKNAHYQQLIEGVTPEDLLPGVRELLDEIRGAGLPIAVASASRNAPALIDRLGIGDRLDAVVDAGRLVRGKPDPEIFLRAAELLGVPPEDCVGVEDAAAGVAALRAAGMPAVGVGDPDLLSEAQQVVPDPSRLRLELLQRAFDVLDAPSAHG